MVKRFKGYEPEVLDNDYEDDGTMPANVEELSSAVVGRKIVSAEQKTVKTKWYGNQTALVITLDDGTQVQLVDSSDCCAYTDLELFWLDPTKVDHVITDVGTTDGYTVWHIYADFGDVLNLKVGWSCGNPFYYGYGFDISVVETA